VSFPAVAPVIDSTQSQIEEMVLTMTNGLVTKIERLDKITHKRKELSAEEYVGVAVSYYAMYYTGIRDYAQALALGNTDVAQAYYQGMTEFFGFMGQT
jgi:hypothetical protein